MAGLGRVRTSKGLLLILSLLCLVHVATSLMDKDTLREIKGNLQKLEEEVARKKAINKLDKAFASEIIDDVKSMIDALKKMVISLLPTFMPELTLSWFPDSINYMIEASKTFYVKMYEDEAALIKDNEEKLRGLKERIKSLEEHQAEL